MPTLLRLVRARESRVTHAVMDELQRARVVGPAYLSALQWNNIAVSAFWLLGDEARSAVPALVQIAEEGVSPDSQRSAIFSLAWIGPGAKEAFPALLKWATNADPRTATVARSALYAIDPEAATKVGISNAWGFSSAKIDVELRLRRWKAREVLTGMELK